MKMPDVYFGSPEDKPVDWKDHDSPDADDEELPETPKSVIGVLGFDPLEFSEHE